VRLSGWDQPWDFDVLQGARTTVAAADFNRGGKVDLIVGDTYGKVRHYRNLMGGANPTFAKPEVIADVGTRLVPTIADWNGDGWPDVIVGSNRAYVEFRSTYRAAFSAPTAAEPWSRQLTRRGRARTCTWSAGMA